MVIERENFVVYYDDRLNYIMETVDYLESKMTNLLAFFGLDKLKNKRKIVVYNDLEQYKKHIEQFYEYHDYMRADTNDGNINLLSVEEAHKTIEHADMTIEEFKSTILHEFVHICQQECEIEHLDEEAVWFWEALATNLGNPEAFKKVVINVQDEEIEDFNNLANNYLIAFTIGNYMLENISHEEIIEYVKYPSKIFANQGRILEMARQWSNIN